MSQCPLCHAAVKDDFGLIECSGCGAQLIVHMDGKVEYQGARESSVAYDQPPPLEQVKSGTGSFEPVEPVREIDLDMIGDPSPQTSPSMAAEPTQMRTIPRPSGASNPGAADLVPPGNSDEAYKMPEDDLYDANRDYTKEVIESRDEETSEVEDEKEFLGADGGGEEEPAEEELSEEAPAEEAPKDSVPDFDGTEDQGPAPLAYNQAPVSSSPDLRDVASFGNSEASGGREGPLRYNLFLEGIDTVDVREAFREALTDRKLMWDTDQILRSVRNGRVNIPNVAPTKAYILITRLRGTPVQVRWEQYAISQS